MLYFTCTETGRVFAYESLEEARSLHPCFENLHEMSEDLWNEFNSPRPLGGEWSSEGWVVSEELLALELEEVRRQEKLSLQSQISELKTQMNIHILLGETEEAREVALKIRELDTKLKKEV